MRVLIIGCGYVGVPLGARLAVEGHEVYGLRRSAQAQGELLAAGIKPLIGDITRLDELSALPAAYDWVVNCAASAGGGLADYRALYLEGTRHLLEWLSGSPPSNYVYTSSTSVYGQNDGSLVDETSPAQPGSESAKVLVETEKLLLATAQRSQFPATILRLAGIYGPGRGYWLKQFLAGEARIEGDGSRYLNMIHRDDVVGAVAAALEQGQPGEIYNVADSEPVTQIEFFQWLSARLGRPLPPFVPEGAGTMRKRGVTNKRVSNRKLLAAVGYELKYPTFREGYATIQRSA